MHTTRLPVTKSGSAGAGHEGAEAPGACDVLRRGSGGDCPLVYTVILNWNGCKETLGCLASVRQLAYPNCCTLIVDNGSTDRSVDQIEAWVTSEGVQFAELTLIKATKNLGFSGGCNLGITHALDYGADYVFILNNDARI